MNESQEKAFGKLILELIPKLIDSINGNELGPLFQNPLTEAS